MSKYAVDDDDIWTEKVWRVRSADGDSKEEVGPVSLDQVRRGIEAGKLDAAAKVARHGSDNWLSAKKLIDAAITRDKALVRKSIST
ncbi:MAG TPA: GYF domain-containing protein, partial [Polyangiaceae bacterium]|nr:GYF domain-containing protein [Polyangiaceae bacterium]